MTRTLICGDTERSGVERGKAKREEDDEDNDKDNDNDIHKDIAPMGHQCLDIDVIGVSWDGIGRFRTTLTNLA